MNKVSVSVMMKYKYKRKTSWTYDCDKVDIIWKYGRVEGGRDWGFGEGNYQLLRLWRNCSNPLHLPIIFPLQTGQVWILGLQVPQTKCPCWHWNTWECPVCYEKFTGQSQVFQCQQGHFVCGTCRPRVNNCPVCRGNMMGRCNGAEQILQSLNIWTVKYFSMQ